MPEPERTIPKVGDRRMGFGEILRRASVPHALEILSPHPKEQWRGRDPGDQVRAEFAGAAVQVDGSLYEVVEHHPPAHDGERHRYLLSPWDPRHPVRGTPTVYSVESVRQAAQERIRRRDDQALRRRLDWLGVFVALLPRTEQERLHREHGFDGIFWTRWSGLVFTIASFAGLVYMLRFLREPWFAAVVVLLLYLLLEQFFRRGKAYAGKPCGSLLGLPLLLLWKRRSSER